MQILTQKNEIHFPKWPSFSDEEIQKVSEVLASGKVNYWTGSEGKLFEEEFAQYTSTKYAIALMNGTVALEAALAALGIGPGDEVITTPRTFIASASSVVMRGAKPVLAEVDVDSQNITAESIKKVITSKTKAIIVVHLAGWACDMESINKLAKENNLYVIEDCAQATGAKYQNKPIGSLSDVAAFSFCQDKILTTGGEGGMITTNNYDIWKRIWSLKDHGKNYDVVYQKDHPPGFRWVHDSFGTNFRMTEMQSAIGRIQLKKLDNWVLKRRHNAAILNKALLNHPLLRIPAAPHDIYHAYYKYYVFLRSELLNPNWTRDKILQAINDAGVPCFSGSCSEIYLEKAFVNNNLSPSVRFPVARQLGETSLMFQVHPTLTDDHMHLMVKNIIKILDQALD